MMRMTPERWREIEGLVDQALRLPGPERAGFLVGRCAGDESKLEQVLDLLLASSEAEAIATPAWSPGISEETLEARSVAEETLAVAATGSAVGKGGESATPVASGARTIGSFRILRELGRGGMGTVYLAEQTTPVERQVALKVAHSPLGSDGRLRLTAERQAMARLSHPNIAQVLEAGSTDDDHPYFAMELIDGEPITAYCDWHRLEVEQRLRLFIAVCSGVQHAHQKGILHRDLKPSNILVTEINGTPVPKIIDFGIAKALDRPLLDLTLDTGEQILGTPAYISPEGMALEGTMTVDTRGDVYSLGVLLQELLIGERPFTQTAGETPLAQLLRKTKEEPASLSQHWRDLDDESRSLLAGCRGSEPKELSRRIRGDLEWIVLRAVAREPSDRYSGVSELAADVERHLHDQPVLAGPPTAGYLLRKLVRRHRLAVVFSVLLLLALTGGFIARSLEAARANRQATEARAARVETEEVVDFLVELFASADPSQALGRELTAREILQAGTARLQDQELKEAPRVQARLFHTTAQVHRSLGEARTGLPLAEEAVAIRRRELGEDHADVASSLVLLGRLENEVGNYERSETLLNEALGLSQKAHGEASIEVAEVLRNLGVLHEETRRYDEALSYYQRALAVVEEMAGLESIEAADILNNMGVVHWRRNEIAEAEAVYRRALEIKEKHHDPHHPTVALTINNLGDMFRQASRYEEAHAMYLRAFETREKVLGADHPHLGVTLNSMGNLKRALGHWDEAEDLLLRARHLWAEALGADHDWIAYAAHNLGVLYYAQGRDTDAEIMLREAIAIERATLGDSDPRVGQGLAVLGRTLRTQGRWAEAAETLKAAQKLLEDPGMEWFLAICLTEQGLIAMEQGRLADAEELLERVRTMAADDDPCESRMGNALVGLSKLERIRGRPRQADELVQHAVTCLENDLPEDHRLLVEARALLPAS